MFKTAKYQKLCGSSRVENIIWKQSFQDLLQDKCYDFQYLCLAGWMCKKKKAAPQRFLELLLKHKIKSFYYMQKESI